MTTVLAMPIILEATLSLFVAVAILATSLAAVVIVVSLLAGYGFCRVPYGDEMCLDMTRCRLGHLPVCKPCYEELLAEGHEKRMSVVSTNYSSS